MYWCSSMKDSKQALSSSLMALFTLLNEKNGMFIVLRARLLSLYISSHPGTSMCHHLHSSAFLHVHPPSLLALPGCHTQAHDQAHPASPPHQYPSWHSGLSLPLQV